MTSCRCRHAGPSGSSRQRRSTRSRARPRRPIRTRTSSAPTCSSIAPLTAHTMARLAHGLADDTLTEAVLAHDGPLLVAPAMNTRMWEHPATQANHELLRARGVEIVGPASGDLAEGEVGVGRMAEPEEIVARAEAILQRSHSLDDKHVVVTAGGTREPIDAVRLRRQPLVRPHGRRPRRRGPPARRPRDAARRESRRRRAPAGVEVVATPTAADLEREALARADADVILMAAAVADYRAADADRRQAGEGRRSLADRARPRRATSPARSAPADGPIRCSSPSAPSTAPRGSSASGRCCTTRTSISSSTTMWDAATSASTARTTRSR